MVFLATAAWGLSCGPALNQVSVTCPPGRTYLDGVCVSEPVADYVACVRAQGAQLGNEKSQKLSAEAGSLGVKAGGAAEVSESLQKKYSASDQAMLAIIQACNGAAQVERRATPAIEKSLVAHWKFDEASGNAAADASNHGNTGTAQGSVSWVAGRRGGALKVGGAGELLVDDGASQHAPRAMTITGWFLLAPGGMKDMPWREILIKSDPKGPNWWGCLSAGEADPSPCDGREYGVSVNSAEGFLLVYATPEDRYKNGGQVFCASAPKSVQFGKWHHFGAVISAKSRAMRVFLDGAPMATCPISEAGLRRTSNKLHIATNFVGLLDDLRIYAAELGDADIAKLAQPE